MALDLVSEVGTRAGAVIYEVDRTTSGVCVAIAWPSGRRNVTAGAVCVKTVGCTGSIMTAVSALTNCSLNDGNNDSAEADVICDKNAELPVGLDGVAEPSSTVLIE